MAPRQEGGFLVAPRRGFGVFDLRYGSLEWIAGVKTGDRMNDGACDPTGRFLAGTTAFNRKSTAGLCRLELDFAVYLVLSNATLHNGIGCAPNDQTMCHVDTPTRQIVAFSYDLFTGGTSEGRIFADLRDSNRNPDGFTLNEEGHAWVAVFRTAEIRTYAPNSKLAQTTRPTASLVTSCRFGGPDLLDLYVTSAAWAMTLAQLESEGLAGGLFHIHTDTRGQKVRRSAGSLKFSYSSYSISTNPRPVRSLASIETQYAWSHHTSYVNFLRSNLRRTAHYM